MFTLTASVSDKSDITLSDHSLTPGVSARVSSVSVAGGGDVGGRVECEAAIVDLGDWVF